MKLKIILIIFLLSTLGIEFAHSQDSSGKTPFFIPQKTIFNVNSNFHWFFDQAANNQWIDQLNFSATMMYSNNLQLNIINRTRSINKLDQYKFTDVNLEYTKYFEVNPQNELFKYGSFLDVKLGMLQWYPNFTNEQLMIENAGRYINPPQIYGGSIDWQARLTSDSALSINVGAHSGDMLYHTTDASLYNFNINYTKILKWNIGVSTQIGTSIGSQHLVNFAYLMYEPKLEQLQLDFKVGKLPSIDASPYGVHLGFKRAFKSVLLGGYVEKRIDQNKKDGVIAGVNWGIIGNSTIAKIFSSFNIIYDFNSSTLWMWIPIIKVDIKNK